MAIQAQLYPENLGLPLIGGGGGPNYSVSQDWFFNNNQILNNFANNNNCFNEITSNNNLQQQKQQQQQQFQFHQQQQQQEVLLQLQQQYLLQLQNQQQRNSCDNNDEGFVFMGSSKNCTPTTTTASTTTSDSDYRVPLNISPCFADTLEKQRQEIDRFITLQNERLKLALQEQRKQQLTTMVRKIEARAKQIIQEKDEEITKALKRRYELEEVIRKMGVENQEWQRIAAENEAMVVSLNNTLQQIKQQQVCCVTSSSSCSSNEVGDAESCCNEGEGSFGNKKRARVEKAEDFETEELKKKKKRGVMCKVCDSRESCVLLLPCRHLCCCKGCVDFIDVCPVCNAMKKASIEALFS